LNSLKVFSCSKNQITKIENLSNSLKGLWCDNVEICDDIPDDIIINGNKYHDKIYQKILNDEVSEIEIINKF